MPSRLSRRQLMLGSAASTLLAGCAGRAPRHDLPPIVFVHGNGDSAALWTTTLWRFESNGWPRDRLVAIDVPYPLARDVDAAAQPGRSSSAENMQLLAAEVERVRAATGAAQVALVGNSRGGITIRRYLLDGNAAARVSRVVLCGTPNHGVWNLPNYLPGSEFNGTGPVLTRLNTQNGAGGAEVTAGPRWLTLRSDSNDKYAQPDGAWIGARGTPTNVGFDGPALRGADNLVLPGADHREVAFGPAAFVETYRFISGQAPAGSSVRPETRVVLDGIVSGYGVDNLHGSAPSNLPIAGATLEVFATDPASGERLGGPRHRKTVGADGRWGPFETDGRSHFEFVVGAAGYAITHVYRSPFPRSSAVVHLRVERLADADRGATALVTLSRPRGYFGVPRDRILFDGQSPPAGIRAGTAGVSSLRIDVKDGGTRAVVAEFNGERLVGRAWPVAAGHLSWLELTS